MIRRKIDLDLSSHKRVPRSHIDEIQSSASEAYILTDEKRYGDCAIARLIRQLEQIGRTDPALKTIDEPLLS